MGAGNPVAVGSGVCQHPASRPRRVQGLLAYPASGWLVQFAGFGPRNFSQDSATTMPSGSTATWAGAYRAAGRLAEAIPISKQTLADSLTAGPPTRRPADSPTRSGCRHWPLPLYLCPLCTSAPIRLANCRKPHTPRRWRQSADAVRSDIVTL